VTCYPDRDNDGHGDPGDPGTVWCDTCPSGYAPANDDCNEENADVFPGNTEWYTDNRDHNCRDGPEPFYTDVTATDCHTDCYECVPTGELNWGEVACGFTYSVPTECYCDSDSCIITETDDRTQKCR
jgi:hypothetical protein